MNKIVRAFFYLSLLGLFLSPTIVFAEEWYSTREGSSIDYAMNVQNLMKQVRVTDQHAKDLLPLDRSVITAELQRELRESAQNSTGRDHQPGVVSEVPFDPWAGV